jgi:hypothetical protein
MEESNRYINGADLGVRVALDASGIWAQEGGLLVEPCPLSEQTSANSKAVVIVSPDEL